MRILVLILMMSVLSQGAFGSDEALPAPVLKFYLPEKIVADEELMADIKKMMGVPGFKKFFDRTITDNNLQHKLEGVPISQQYDLIKTIEWVFNSFSLDDLLSQQLDLGLGLEDIIRINLSRLEKIPHDDIVEKFNTNSQQYLAAIPPGLEKAELREYLLGGLSKDSRNGEMIGYLANTEREQEEGEREE